MRNPTGQPAATEVGVPPRPHTRAGAWRERIRFGIWTAPALLITIAILVPFGIAVYYSLTDKRLAVPGTEFVGLDNYRDVLGSEDFRHNLRVTFTSAAFVCLIELPLGLAVAYRCTATSAARRCFASPPPSR
jgi:multiple sugar transport system permease protein